MNRPRIAAITTLRWPETPNTVWVQVECDNGIIGLGETFYNPAAVEATVHELIAPSMVGADPLEINRHWRDYMAAVHFGGAGGAEVRAYSAVDIALWDVLGQTTGLPIHTLLGGALLDRVSVYNSCSDAGPYQDSTRLQQDPGALALELIELGYPALKLAPWDRYAPSGEGRFQTGSGGRDAIGPAGHRLALEQLEEGLQVVREVREAAGDRIEILLEGHARWDLTSATRIARAVEPLRVGWMEDFIQPSSAEDLRRLASATTVPQAVSERLMSRSAYRDVIASGAAGIVMFDVAWCGGISEASRIADLADAQQLPFTPHDCTGPVTVAANLHLAAAKPNFMIAETVRGFIEGTYREICDRPFTVTDGSIPVPRDPGLGIALSPAFLSDKEVTRRQTVA